jgi:CBS domain containing-hemolysin-like protein
VNFAAWAVLLGAVLASLFISVVHFTLRRASRVRLEEAFAGPRRAGWLALLDARLDELILGTAFLRTLCHLLILLSVVRLLTRGRWSVDLLAVVLAAAIVALAGIGIPHAWAKYAGERTTALVWPVLTVLHWVLWPLTRALRALDAPIRRLSGQADLAPLPASEVEQEILHLASEGQAGGGADADEMEMISSVIEFHDIRVGQIMTPRTDIEALEVTSDRQQCIEMVQRVGHSRIPIFQDTLDNIVGVLYAKDLLSVAGGEAFDLRKSMREPLFVPQSKPISDLLKELKHRQVHIAIVLDEYGGTAGLVTIEDLLEVLVGEISDEFEAAEPPMLKRLDERTVEVDARMYIDDLNDELELKLPEGEDYDTVGGFVFSTLGYIPRMGESFEYAGLRFSVIEAEPRRVKRVRITLPQPPSAEPH